MLYVLLQSLPLLLPLVPVEVLVCLSLWLCAVSLCEVSLWLCEGEGEGEGGGEELLPGPDPVPLLLRLRLAVMPRGEVEGGEGVLLVVFDVCDM